MTSELTLCVMQESVTTSERTLRCANVLHRANPCSAFWLLRQRSMRLLFLIIVFFYLALWGFIANSMLYARRRFKLSSQAAAVLLSLFGGVSALAQSVGLSLARKAACRLGQRRGRTRRGQKR